MNMDEILTLRIKSLIMWGRNATEEEYKNNFDNCVEHHLGQLKQEINYEMSKVDSQNQT